MERLLCQTCWSTIFNTEALSHFWRREAPDFVYHVSYEKVRRSSNDANCQWCSFLLSTLPDPSSVEWPSSWTVTSDVQVVLEQAYEIANSSPKGLNHCQLDFGTVDSPRDLHVEFDLMVDDSDVALHDDRIPVTARPMQWRVDATQAYDQIRRWTDSCQRSHENCKVIAKDTVIPSRAIEIVPLDTEEQVKLRLTDNIQGPYLALSYCWGYKQSYVLTSTNREQLYEELDVSLLPQTIRDAVGVARSLGHRYLWVDALCIMQDNATPAARGDMDRELGKMAQVYRGALMTIVASSASNARKGFLARKAPLPRKSFSLPCRLGQNDFFISRIVEHQMSTDRTEPINLRAWTYQEQMLSSRLLIYASHTLQWQCRSITCNLGDSYHAPSPSAAPRLTSPEELVATLSDTSQLPIDHNSIANHGSMIPHSQFQTWLRLVVSYSSRDLSVLSDKLPAISALAASYAPIFGPAYHGGIWSRNPVQQLCWRRVNMERNYTRPSQYRAPSWSWASVDGSVYFPSFLKDWRKDEDVSVCTADSRLRILDWWTRPKNNLVPYGEVEAGKLSIAAAFKKGELYSQGGQSLIRLVNEESPQRDSDESQRIRAIIDAEQDAYPRNVRCAAMYVTRRPKDTGVGGWVLVPSSTDQTIFQRIGLFETGARHFANALVQQFDMV